MSTMQEDTRGGLFVNDPRRRIVDWEFCEIDGNGRTRHVIRKGDAQAKTNLIGLNQPAGRLLKGKNLPIKKIRAIISSCLDFRPSNRKRLSFSSLS